MNEQILTGYFHWIAERQSIYQKKQAGEPKPWTTDEIMQRYKFCNVFREQDTVTIWIDKNIRQRWASHPYLWFALCVARRINLPETLAQLDDLLVDWDWVKAEAILNNRRKSKQQIYSSAYMLTTGGRSVPKNYDTCHNILQSLWEKREVITNHLENLTKRQRTLEYLFNVFSKGHVGYSGFIAYEIVTDMRHTRYLLGAKDIDTWANAGPGAIRGLNRLYERPLQTKVKACTTNKEMQQLLSYSALYLPEGFPRMEMRDIEHCLCEYDKYLRVKHDKAFLRQRYNGAGE